MCIYQEVLLGKADPSKMPPGLALYIPFYDAVIAQQARLGARTKLLAPLLMLELAKKFNWPGAAPRSGRLRG